MLNIEKCENHILAWLIAATNASYIAKDPQANARYRDLYALYLRTVKDLVGVRDTNGKPLARSMFSLYLTLNGVEGIYGTGNIAYRRGIRILDKY